MDGFGMYIVIPGLDEDFLKSRQQKMCVFEKQSTQGTNIHIPPWDKKNYLQKENI